MLVDPANELLSAVDNSQVSVSEDPSSVITRDLEPIGDPLHSSSFVAEACSLQSTSLNEETLSQSSLTDELSRSAGQHTSDVEQPTEPPTFSCGCSRILNGKQCSTLFSPQYYQMMRDNCAELTKTDLDNIIKGQIMAFTSMNEVTKCISHHSESIKERQKVRGTYYHQGQKICWRTFAYLHVIGKIHTLYT